MRRPSRSSASTSWPVAIARAARAGARRERAHQPRRGRGARPAGNHTPPRSAGRGARHELPQLVGAERAPRRRRAREIRTSSWRALARGPPSRLAGDDAGRARAKPKSTPGSLGELRVAPRLARISSRFSRSVSRRARRRGRAQEAEQPAREGRGRAAASRRTGSPDRTASAAPGGSRPARAAACRGSARSSPRCRTTRPSDLAALEQHHARAALRQRYCRGDADHAAADDRDVEAIAHADTLRCRQAERAPRSRGRRSSAPARRGRAARRGRPRRSPRPRRRASRTPAARALSCR